MKLVGKLLEDISNVTFNPNKWAMYDKNFYLSDKDYMDHTNKIYKIDESIEHNGIAYDQFVRFDNEWYAITSTSEINRHYGFEMYKQTGNLETTIRHASIKVVSFKYRKRTIDIKRTLYTRNFQELY